MTRITGFTLVASPCCRALYKTPQYSSINLSAMGYWTDGQKEFGLMPSGGGQRKCKCGQFYLLREAIKLELDAEAETPHTVFVDAAGVHIKPSSSTLWQALARRAPQMEKGLLQASIQQQVFQKIAQAMFMLRTPITTLSDKLSRNDSSSTQTNCQLFPLSNRQPTLTTPSLVNTRA